MGLNLVSYFGDFNLGNFFYGMYHPMKPLRISMLHDLVLSYGLYKYMNYKYPRKVPKTKFNNFHFCYFINKLSEKKILGQSLLKENLNVYFPQTTIEDCPIFTGIMEYCEKYSAGSLNAATELTGKKAITAINWAGGLHHAKANEASGFCYTNDIVLAILELLRGFPRILYIDIDIHHGDGVEEAFYFSDKVFTLSFHHYKNGFFPETGQESTKGAGNGKYFSANVPLKKGLNDESLGLIFKPIVKEIILKFDPSAIVFQSGADSLSGDQLGFFNISLRGHSECIEFVKNTDLPLLILGGGGYTKTNVARCWTYETSFLLKKKLSNYLPFNNFWRSFYPMMKLNIYVKNEADKNSKKNLKNLKNKILKNIKYIKLK